MGARSGGGRAAGGGFGSASKSTVNGGRSGGSGRKSNPFSASAAMKLMGIDKNAAKLLKSGMFGF